MTDQEVREEVEMWNGNMNIFEIYEELSERYDPATQERLLNHAYDEWNWEPMLKLLEELASHLGVRLENQTGISTFMGL